MILAALVRRGYHVLIPFGEGHPYDLAIWLDGTTFARVQSNQKRGVRFAADFEIDRWSLDSLRALVVTEPAEEESLATVA